MKNIIYILFLFLAIGCGKDDEVTSSKLLTNETISGTVSYDNGDPCCTEITVSIIKRAIIDTVNDTLATVEIGPDGAYLFDNILPGQADLYITVNIDTHIVSATDETPDGDPIEGFLGLWIGVFLEEDENDDGNNFVLGTSACESSLILGTVYSVIDQDTTELPEEIIINLYNTDANGNLLDLEDSRNTTGSFSFTVANGFNGTLDIDFGSTSLMPFALSVKDESPDDDPTFGLEITHLPVVLDSCETDADNNIYLFFDVNQTSISGTVLLDINEDGIGDEAIDNQRIELYERNSDNVPMMPLIDAINSDAAGKFEFYDIPEGEYVLYFIGNGQYNVVQSYDEDQESGEPNNDNPLFISVDIIDSEISDDNNLFLLNLDTGCNAMPTIMPYPALCDTSIVCSYDELPIFVIDEMGVQITTVGGIYQLEWTDLVTGQSTVGDWTYQTTNHPIELSISYPDGCDYTITYLRDCDQDLNGTFSMLTMTTGFGPTYEYEIEEVQWTFFPSSGKVAITHNIVNTANNPSLLPSGIYVYTLIETTDGLNLTMQKLSSGITYDVGLVKFQNGQLLLDDDIAADGIGRFFEKN